MSRLSVRIRTALCFALVGFLTGCPSTGPSPGDSPPDTDGGDSTPVDPDAVTGGIDSILLNRVESVGGREISIAYSVTGTPDSVSGFYVCVARPCPIASPLGEREIILPDLPASGPDRVFPFNPGDAGVGSFRVGILLTIGDEQVEALSVGVIQVNPLPAPCFAWPCEPVVEGDPEAETFVGCGGSCKKTKDYQKSVTPSVEVRFDAGVSVGEVHWRLFYLLEPASDIAPDELGTLIKEGVTPFDSATFSITGHPLGSYEFGLSSTGSGSPIAETVQNGEVDRIITVFGPTIRIIE